MLNLIFLHRKEKKSVQDNKWDTQYPAKELETFLIKKRGVFYQLGCIRFNAKRLSRPSVRECLFAARYLV